MSSSNAGDDSRNTSSGGDVSPRDARPTSARNRLEPPPIDTTYSGSADSGTSTIRQAGRQRTRDGSGASEQRPSDRSQPSEPQSSTSDRRRSPYISTSQERDRILSPDRERPPTAPRPKPARRMSSKMPRPGQQFSVDDDGEEILRDLQLKAQKQRPSAAGLRSTSTGYMQMRRNTAVRKRGASYVAAPPIEEPMEEEEENEIMEEPGTMEEEEEQEEEQEHDEDPDSGTYEASDVGTVDSFTLKDRQEAINDTHPFGIKIWKPSLYKKDRSVQKIAEGEIHSVPGKTVTNPMLIGNVLWIFLFGWWLALAALIGAVACFMVGFSESGRLYGRAFWGLSSYIIYPFGRVVQLEQDETYIEEDEGEGRSIGEYERWNTGDLEVGTRTLFEPSSRNRNLVGRRRESLDNISETNSLLGADERRGLLSGEVTPDTGKRRRLFGRGKWTVGRLVFFLFFYLLVGPLLLLVCGVCWLLVFTIPMGKVTSVLLDHLRRHPLALTFLPHGVSPRATNTSSVLLCTYRAVGWKYYKYTVDGTNIFFINLIGVVIFVIFDNWVLNEWLGIENALTASWTLFVLALASIIPLAYFIGQAVASVSAQSSMGLASVLNAFFSTIVEVFLYCVALKQGKGRLVEGSLVGSVLAGILLMPGLSMCAGSTYRKTQKFNVKSAEATVTMLLFAVIGAFAPTLFYQIYGTYELKCRDCDTIPQSEDCRRCYFTQVPTVDDSFYLQAVRPFCYIASVLLVLSYVVGCAFTLKTHSSSIWETPASATAAPPAQTRPNTVYRPPSRALDGNPISHTHAHKNSGGSLRESALYKRLLGQTLRSAGYRDGMPTEFAAPPPPQTVHIVPPKTPGGTPAGDASQTPVASNSTPNWLEEEPGNAAMGIPTLSPEENLNLTRNVAELAATAAVAAVQDVQRNAMPELGPRKSSMRQARLPSLHTGEDAAEGHGGHDAPNWSRLKSMIILCGATVLYAAVAEILVNTVDVVLENVNIDEKFLGITLFALVPNSTEFLNAISFAINGNVALSMEIGSAYALQVCLLQMPALVFFTAMTTGGLAGGAERLSHMFTLIFPQWDLVTVILCVFLLTNIIHEGKSNYFKGSILILAYITVMLGFYFSGYLDGLNNDDSSVDMRMGGSGGGWGAGSMNKMNGMMVGNRVGHAGELRHAGL